MSGKLLLDTNAVIELFRGNRAAHEAIAGAEVFLSSTVMGELLYGAERSARVKQNQKQIEQFALGVPVLSCDEESARYYARIKDQLRAKGLPIPENDIWIAAVAQQYGLTLLTRDQHFQSISDLPTRIW